MGKLIYDETLIKAINELPVLCRDPGWVKAAVLLTIDKMPAIQPDAPKVMTLDEIKDGESYWLSAGKELVTRPVICVHREDDARIPYITFVWQFGTISFMSEDYGKTWCCWTSRPTEEQREAVKWDD